MFKINNLTNDNIKIIEQKGNIKVLEFEKDQSLTPDLAQVGYFSEKMNIKKRQVLIELNNDSYTVSAGAMQWMLGNIYGTSNIKGVTDFFGKAIKGAVTNESTSKPVYEGTGLLMLEPTYKHILLEDLNTWGGNMIIDDGLFIACESTIKNNVIMRSNISSAVLGNQGLFNLCLSGNGIVALESPVPRSELIEIELDNDVIKVDGNFVIAWSKSLDFTVEKSTKSLIGSAISKEGFVNVYRGTGKLLLAPVCNNPIVTLSPLIPSNK